MIFAPEYVNSKIYYNLMQDFLENKISAWDFRKRYMRQRSNDIDNSEIAGYTLKYYKEVKSALEGNKKLFYEKYFEDLGDHAYSDDWYYHLLRYDEAANKLDIKGEWFFMGIYEFIQYDIHDYYPSDDPGFEEEYNTDEKTLREKVRAVFDVLSRNRHRWDPDIIGLCR